jgi:hypothetical protein
MANSKDQNKAAANIKAAREQSIKQTAEAVEANSGLAAPTGGALKSAQQEGIVEAVKESAKDTYKALTDGALPGAPPARQFTGMDEVMQYAGILDLGVDQFRERIEQGGPVPEEKVAGLLSLERAGRNRTIYVKALMDRLGIDHPREVTSAGPDYTQDETPISQL